jgi:hypothetical protein
MTIKSAVDLLQREYDGSKTNQYSRYTAVCLLEKWIKQLITFANISHKSPESFYNHLWDIISGYQTIVENEKKSDNYKSYKLFKSL